MGVTENAIDPLLRASVVAEWLGTTEGRLANLRSAGIGPAFVKIGHSVRYRQSDVEAYLTANTVQPIGA
jgi:predicted DNA-binding transcriptional regulator AlpA